MLLADNWLEDERKIPTSADFIKKWEIDRSTLYSFDELFQLVHADVENLEFLGSSATTPRYVFLSVDLYSWKVHVYPMRSRKQILQKIALFYDEIKNKRKNKLMTLQVNSEFQQVRIKDLNEMNNVEMFTTSAHRGKAFAAEQKIKELKTRISKLNAQKQNISSTKIILNSAINMNNVPSEKYGLTPEEIEKKSISNERFRTIFNMHPIERTELIHDRLTRYDKKKYDRTKKKLRENLNINEKVLVLAERIRKKSAPGKSSKQSVQNISYFNKEKVFFIRKKQKIDKISYYWLKDSQNKKLTKRFQRNEFFAVNNNFTVYM